MRRPRSAGAASPPWVLMTAAVAAVALAAACCGRGCQAFLLPPPGGVPSSRWGAGRAGAGGAASRWHGQRATAPVAVRGLTIGPGRPPHRQRRRTAHPVLYAADTTITTAAPAPKHEHHADWARFGEENAPTLLGLRRAAIKGNVEAAEAAVAAIEAQGIRADLIMLTHLMQAYAVRRDVEGAKGTLARMERDGLEPDLVPFSILLNLHADLADVKAAEAVFGEFAARGLPRSTRAFTALMKAYMRARDPEGAEDVLFRMAASGQAPDIHAYTILLRAYAKIGDVRGAEDVMRRVLLATEASGGDGSSSVPPIVASADADADAVAEGEQEGGGEGSGAGQQEPEPFRPDAIIFNALLRLHVKKSIRLKRAGKGSGASDEGVASVLQRMGAFHVPPDETTAALLATHRGERRSSTTPRSPQSPAPAAAGAAAGAEGSSKPPRRQQPQQPPRKPRFQGEQGAEGEGSPDERVRVLEAGLRAKLEGGGAGEVGEEEVLAALRACVEAEDDVSARRVLALLPPPLATLNAHNLLLHLHARRGDTSGAERVLGQVLRQGLPPSLTTYNTLLQAYVRRGARARRMAGEEYKRVLQVYDTLRGSRDPALWPDSYTLTALLRCLQARATQQQGQGGYHSSNNSNVEAIKEPYAQMLRDVNVLLDAKRRPSQLYTALLGAAAAVGDWPTVERAYKDAEQQLAAGCMPQRAFRFVERAYRRLMGGRAAAGEGEGGGEEKEAVVRREEEAAVAVVAIK